MTSSSSEDSQIIRLPRNGPKPGQSMNNWLYGKDKTEQRELERLRWQHENKGR